MRFKRHNAWAARRKVIPTAPPNEGRFCALNVSENDRVASPRSRLRWRATPRQALYSSFTRWRKRRSSRPDPPAPWKRKLGTLRNLRSLFDRSLYYPPSFSLRSFIPRLPFFFCFVAFSGRGRSVFHRLSREGALQTTPNAALLRRLLQLRSKMDVGLGVSPSEGTRIFIVRIQLYPFLSSLEVVVNRISKAPKHGKKKKTTKSI